MKIVNIISKMMASRKNSEIAILVASGAGLFLIFISWVIQRFIPETADSTIGAWRWLAMCLVIVFILSAFFKHYRRDKHFMYDKNGSMIAPVIDMTAISLRIFGIFTPILATVTYLWFGGFSFGLFLGLGGTCMTIFATSLIALLIERPE